MATIRAWALAFFCLALCLLNATSASAQEPVASVFADGFRGVTVGPIESSQQPNKGYGTAASGRLLDHLAKMGVNWVSITPFGRIFSLKSTTIDLNFEMDYEQNVRGIETFVDQAHARGIKVLLIPHLWVESPGWRGEIDPGSDKGWQAYQKSYEQFVTTWAKNAERADADAFSVGVECKSWSGRDRKVWERIIGKIRKVFHGPLTYSSNWDEADNVIFWDLLDVIGINAFYPLAEKRDDGVAASDEEYLEGARRWVSGLNDLSDDFDKPILFVEIGYTTRKDSAIEPWLWPDDMKDVWVDEHEAARAMHALLCAFLPQRFFSGFFVWRYYADLADASQEAVWGFCPHAKVAEMALEMAVRADWAFANAPAIDFWDF